MKTIGITGGIGTGKSTVAKILSKMGFVVLSSDEMAHSLLQKDTPTYQEVVNTFGLPILNPDGEIARRTLGEIVFGNPQSRAKLEQILHPAIIAQIKKQITIYDASGLQVLFVEVPLLFEVGMESLFDQVWVVGVTPEEQLKRIGTRDQLPEEEIRRRLSAQLPLTEKIARADQVIMNNADLNHLERQVSTLLQKLELI